MFRAVPITVRTADSIFVVFRSTSLILAISSTCFFVTLPTLLRFGSAEPLTMPAARSNKIEAGGVFKINVNVRSVYTVTSTGKIIPSGSLAVLALNCLQKSMMFKPWGPSAVPTGGAGVALPAGNWSLMVVCTFFGGIFPLPQNPFENFNPAKHYGAKAPRLHRPNKSTELFDAGEIEFDRRRAAKNRYGNFQAAMVVVDLLDRAVEIRKRAVHDADLLIAFVHNLGLRPILRRVHAVDDAVHFRFRKRRRRSGRTDETGDARRVAHDVPGIFVEIHFDEHITRIRHARRDDLLAAANLHDVFHGNQDAANLILQIERRHAAFQAFFHFLLKARVGMDDVPLHCHVRPNPFYA